MNKKIKFTMFTILGIFLLASVTAIITLENGNKIISQEEMAGLNDNQIDNYMTKNSQLTGKTLLSKRIGIDYNLSYLEPTHNNGSFREFKQRKRFFISTELVKKCLSKTNIQNCKEYLVTSMTPFTFTEIVNNESINVTIISTNLQASNEQDRLIKKAKRFRDEAQANELQELFDLI